MAEYTGGNDANVPFESARQNADRLGINYGALPHLPFWSRMFGQSMEDYHTKVAAKIMSSSAGIGRELSQPEKDAMAHHFGKLIVTFSYGSPIAIITTVGFLRRTNATYGFPFWTPKPPQFNPEKFPGLPEGSASRVMWHLSRTLAWYTANKVVVSLFMTSYAVSVYAANVRADSRLEAYRQDLSRRANRPAGSDQLVGVAQESAEHRQQPMSTYGSSPVSTPTSAPTSWADPEKSRQGPISSWTETQTPQSEPRQESLGEETSIFDDASPVAPSEQQRQASQKPTQQGSSAWDRLRNQAQTSRNQTTLWARKREDEMTSRGAQQGTSYNYSSVDEEKAYAKEQAQKEFDDMLEEERRGQSSYSKRR